MAVMWPKGFKAALAIGVDDLSPMSRSDGCDLGGDLENGSLGLLEKFLERYRLKATLFVIPCYIYKPPPRGVESIHRKLRNVSKAFDKLFYRMISIWPHEKFNISMEKNKAFVEYLNSLINKGIIEVGLHGLFHFNYIPPYASEFKFLDKNQIRKRIETALMILDKSNLRYIKGFAPPGWGVNRELVEVLDESSFTFIAGSADFKTPVSLNAQVYEAGLRGTSLLFPTRIGRKIINMPRNWTPHRNTILRAKQILELGGLLGIHLHIENECHGVWLGNGVTEENIAKLEKLIDFIDHRYGREYIWVTTFNSIATHEQNMISPS